MIEVVSNKFIELFKQKPLVFKAPGRINLIGEHTDYNLGFVMPAAINQGIYFAIEKSNNDFSTFHSLDLNETLTCDIQQLNAGKGWYNYLAGVIGEIQKVGKIIGQLNLVFGGDIPIGAGLSSSAALECGFTFAINQLFDLKLDKIEMIRISQMAEHNFVGVKCGIMDQFASMMGIEDHVIRLDCEDLSYDYFPLNLADAALLLCDSKVNHNLASSEYNVRRSQCETGVQKLNEKFDGVKSLRDVSIDQLENSKELLEPIIYKRCKYIIEENLRVKEFAEALHLNDLSKAGDILNTAQIAMRDEYEITCPEIDFLAKEASGMSFVLGARMMGGGFGGCTLNLLKKNEIAQFKEQITSAYEKEFSISPEIIEVHPSTGVQDLS